MEPEVEGNDCGELKGDCETRRVDLACCGACHQAPQFSAGRPMVLQKASLEDSSTSVSSDRYQPRDQHELIACTRLVGRLYDFGDKCPDR
jgi:hypothetical protein